MRRVFHWLAGCLGILLLAGCHGVTRVSTHAQEVPRVDLDLSGGNRGYLVGSAPEAGNLKTTRQIVQTDIEIPTRYAPKRGGKQAQLPGVSSQEPAEAEGITVGAQAQEAGSFDTYVVQKGDSLWSIAAKPSIYGRTSAWRRIFDANRELLKGDPNRLQAGMTLRIPRGGEAEKASLSGKDSGMTFTK